MHYNGIKFFPVKTRLMEAPKDNIFTLLEEIDFKFQNKDLLFITTKILSIHQGRCIKYTENKDELIKAESDWYWERGKNTDYSILLTIKDNVLIPSAGIDESNANDYQILWPKNIEMLLSEIHKYICKKHNISQLGIISTDSTTAPLKRGVIGIATACYGFDPIKDYIGTKDLFGRKFKFSKVNIPNNLAATAVMMMGEGEERTPICIVRDTKEDINFNNISTTDEMICELENDLFKHILIKNAIKNGSERGT